MKLFFLIAFIVIPITVSPAFSQSGFKNPDGRPSSIAVEPLFAYFSDDTFSEDLLKVGLAITAPINERITVLASGFFGRSEVHVPFVRYYENGWTGIVNESVKQENEQVGFQLSVRIWLGGGKGE